MKVKVGDVAPDFKLASNVKPEISLSEYSSSKSLVL
jgi:peroxiredoxin